MSQDEKYVAVGVRRAWKGILVLSFAGYMPRKNPPLSPSVNEEWCVDRPQENENIQNYVYRVRHLFPLK